MPANVDAMVREGINAYRAGKKEEARTLLFKAVELNDQHEQAWLWLSAVVDSTDDQLTCLENVLTINPHNERARQGIEILNQKLGTPLPTPQAPATPSPADDEDLLASMSFTDPAPAMIEAEEEELPDMDWSLTETSSASSQRQINEPSPNDYDDWVTGLNLKGGQSMMDDEEPFSNPLMLDQTAHEVFGFEDDFSETDNRQTPSAFDDDDMFGGPFDSLTGFDDDLDDAPPPAPKSSMSSALRAAPMSPAFDDDDDDEHDPLFEAIGTDDDFDSFGFDDDFDDLGIEAIEPEEYFKSIPEEIRATRLPGSNERPPLLLLLGLVAMLALNAGALYLVISTLTTS